MFKNDKRKIVNKEVVLALPPFLIPKAYIPMFPIKI